MASNGASLRPWTVVDEGRYVKITNASGGLEALCERGKLVDAWLIVDAVNAYPQDDEPRLI